MNGKSSGVNSWLAIVILGPLCGFFFVVVPIGILYFSFVDGASYVKWSCVVWIVVLLCLFSAIKDKALKFGCGVVVCLIYASIYDSDFLGNYIELEDVLASSILSFTMLAPMYFIGEKIRGKIDSKRLEKKHRKMEDIKTKIVRCNNEISRMETEIEDRKHTLKLIYLMRDCGADTYFITDSPELSSIENIYTEIGDKKKSLKELQAKLEAL